MIDDTLVQIQILKAYCLVIICCLLLESMSNLRSEIMFYLFLCSGRYWKSLTKNMAWHWSIRDEDGLRCWGRALEDFCCESAINPWVAGPWGILNSRWVYKTAERWLGWVVYPGRILTNSMDIIVTLAENQLYVSLQCLA